MNPPKSIICNTTILSNFASVHRVELLTRALVHPLFTTPQVVDEINAGVQAGYTYLEDLEALLISTSSPFTLLSLTIDELATFRDLRLRLHTGEASCLAIAVQRNYVFGTDDLAARKIAQAKHVPVIGTVAILVSCRRGLLTLDEANHILRQMIDAGYRSPVDRLDHLWK